VSRMPVWSGIIFVSLLAVTWLSAGRYLTLVLDRIVTARPAALAQDPERLARFEREAKVLAAMIKRLSGDHLNTTSPRTASASW